MSSLGFDPTTGRALLIGGAYNLGFTIAGEIWSWDGTTFALEPESMGPSQLHSVASATTPDGLFSFGGAHEGPRRDLWRYAYGQWSTPELNHPAAGFGPCSVMVPDTGHVFAFGGLIAKNTPALQALVYRGDRWATHAPAPVLRVCGAALDPTRNTVVRMASPLQRHWGP